MGRPRQSPLVRARELPPPRRQLPKRGRKLPADLGALRADLAKAAFDFLPARVLLDLEGWAEQDIFAH